MKYLLSFLTVLLVAVFASPDALSEVGGNYGDTAPDFPSGEFSDGGHYHLSDFRGRLLVLFFYEQKCPTCRATIAGRNKIVRRYAGEPVNFIGVGAGDSLEEVKAYVQETRLNMPVFADTHNRMEKAYGFKISLHNIYQVRLISADGIVIGYDMQPSSIDEALQSMRNDTGNSGAAPAVGVESRQEDGTTARPSRSANKGGVLPDSPAGRRHIEMIRLNNEAVESIKSGDNLSAIDKLKTVLKREPDYKLARENLRTACSYHAVDLENQGKIAEAEKMMKQAFDLAKELYAPDNPNYAESLTDYAGILSRTGRHAEAEKLMRELKTGNLPD
jgi:peroxiredoxin